MNFSVALDTLKMGHKVKRESWSGIEYLFIVPKYRDLMGDMNAFKEKYPFDVKVNMHTYIAVLHTDGTVKAWNPTLNDLLSNNWLEV